MLVDSKGENWFRWANVVKFLGLAKIMMSVEGLDAQEMPQRDDIKAMVSNPYPWPGTKNHQSKTDKFLSSSLASCMSLQTLKKTRARRSKTTS